MVVGCSGEIGSRLTKSLLSFGYTVYGVSGNRDCRISHLNHECQKLNLLDPETNIDFKTTKVDLIILTAWITKPKVFWNSPINWDWLAASKKIITDFMISGGSRVVVLSSCAEYGWEINEPLSENSALNPNSTYGASKLELFIWLNNQAVSYLWVRIFFQFGLGEATGRLIPSLVDSLYQNKSFVVVNSGAIRDFVYIIDVVKVLTKLIVEVKNGVYNLGTGCGVTIKTVSNLIGNFMGKSNLITYQDLQFNHNTVVSNPRKLQQIVGGYNWTPLENALIETIEFRTRL